MAVVDSGRVAVLEVGTDNSGHLSFIIDGQSDTVTKSVTQARAESLDIALLLPAWVSL